MKSDAHREIDRLREENKKLRALLKTLVYDKIPNIPFITGEGGDIGKDGMHEYLYVCPAYGCDFFIAYKKVKNDSV